MEFAFGLVQIEENQTRKKQNTLRKAGISLRLYTFYKAEIILHAKFFQK